MQKINQNSAIQAQIQALTPNPDMIDGRTEKDWLGFISGFAELINFYDENNNQNGSWKPFLLKDPLFLTATIAGTPFKKYHNLYRSTDKKLKLYINKDIENYRTAINFNQLFDQLSGIFIQIKSWVHYMQTSDEEYALKKYVIHQAKNTISPYFWAINSFRQNLYLSQLLPGITPVDTYRYPLYSVYEEKIWKENKSTSPYWEVLNLKHPLDLNSKEDILNAVTAVGNIVFKFFHTVIHHANKEFDNIKKETGSYPDTVLVRSFVDLLKIYQKEVNGIANKHLAFYYRDILKQKPNKAIADKAYIYLTLTKKNPFLLPEGTAFNAGTDANKNPILFTTTEDVTLNPAIITEAYTMSVLPQKNDLYSLQFKNIDTPSVIKKNEEGVMQSWEAFGETKTSPATTVNTGIAFASPMLLLKEGKRKVTFTFEFDKQYNLTLLKNARYYLSTQKTWLEVTDIIQFTDYSETAQSLIADVLLDNSQPPIEPFASHPDGIESSWPMLKVVFEEITTPTTVPVLTQLTIDVTVTGMKNFNLYNDYGTLSTKKPYPPLGPVPAYNSSFIIGNSEMMSKPLNTWYFELNWDKLPKNGFADYYEQYNNYINEYELENTNGDEEEVEEDESSPKDEKDNWLINTLEAVGKALHIIENNIKEKEATETYNNYCFTVKFQQLFENNWVDIDVTQLEDISISSDNTITDTAYTIPTECAPTVIPEGTLLFTTEYSSEDKVCKLQSSTLYKSTKSESSDNIQPDADIQLTPLKFSDSSTNGFIRMVLTALEKYGFGSDLYPKVIADVTLKNAEIVFKKDDTNKPSPAPNVPFVPNLTLFTGHYTASQTYSFSNNASANEPIECFWYTPLSNYKVYDSTDGEKHYEFINNTESIDTTTGLLLFSPLYYKGYMFLKMDNAVTSNTLNLYVEIATSYKNELKQQQPYYYYFSTKGWKALPVVKDGTNNFNCPGIITANLPEDMSNNSLLFPDSSYYIAVAVDDIALSPTNIIAVTTNGVCVQRSSVQNSVSITPKLAANSITKPQNAIPEIASVVQPFPSFGGKAAENEKLMNVRVSNRIKTKERAVSKQDFIRIIKQQYPSVYFCKPVYNAKKGITYLYVVKCYDTITDTNALTPAITVCDQTETDNFLANKITAFTTAKVLNFDFQYVKVVADIIIGSKYECYAVQKAVNTAINTFISPWVASNEKQHIIDTPIANDEILHCISKIEGIIEVNSISFSTWTTVSTEPIIKYQAVTTVKENMLLVSAGQHQITCNKAI